MQNRIMLDVRVRFVVNVRCQGNGWMMVQVGLDVGVRCTLGKEYPISWVSLVVQ